MNLEVWVELEVRLKIGDGDVNVGVNGAVV